MDATMSSDGSFVMMKQVESPGSELDIARSDPANHCVPIYNVLSDPHEPGWAIIVMPLLRSFDRPRFDTIGEAVGFFTQIFEGLQFMHKNIDCTSKNIMMHGSSLYPVPFHPVQQHLKRDFSGKAPHLTRTQRPYKPEDRPPLEPIIMAGDKSAPEYRVCDACDPFPTDVYHLGNLIRGEFCRSQKRGFEFMEPLVADMVQTDPSLLRRFGDIVQGLSSRNDFGFYYSVPHWIRRLQFIVKRFYQYRTYSNFGFS
ncbi:hypothetical protein B0H10DRAFT_2169885 [Mycena sp. CBHHK59/15]|nr:hypothetical protein B0H10DRAFT_2169885 [Mycena sp. CBHHK59/15]